MTTSTLSMTSRGNKVFSVMVVLSNVMLSFGFSLPLSGIDWTERRSTLLREKTSKDGDLPTEPSRRSLLANGVLIGSSMLTGGLGYIPQSSAAVGTLPEFSGTSAILQGLTINVADQSQQKAMIEFLVKSFEFKILRQRISDNIEETWLGFGPEELGIPKDFEIPVSSFNEYGGHASICVRYNTLAKAPLYRIGDSPPGDNIAYLQVGVPNYRISQMVANGGNVLDAYGYVNVLSPSGLPIRAIVGIRPDPMMFIATNCEDVQKSRAYYEKLGFTEQPYPYARPSNGTGPFEPAQPKKSVYLAPSPNCMGVLLLPSKTKKVTANPVLDSLRIVYTPSEGAEADDSLKFIDPSQVQITFQSASSFEKEEQQTR